MLFCIACKLYQHLGAGMQYSIDKMILGSFGIATETGPSADGRAVCGLTGVGLTLLDAQPNRLGGRRAQPTGKVRDKTSSPEQLLQFKTLLEPFCDLKHPQTISNQEISKGYLEEPGTQHNSQNAPWVGDLSAPPDGTQSSHHSFARRR